MTDNNALAQELENPWLNNPTDIERGAIPDWCSGLLHRAAAALRTPAPAPVGGDVDVLGSEYRKTATIRAKQWWKQGDHPAVIMKSDRNRHADPEIPWVETLEGGHIVTPGDWIATGIKGEHWPIKPDVFASTYVPVAALQAPVADEVPPFDHKVAAAEWRRTAQELRDTADGNCSVIAQAIRCDALADRHERLSHPTADAAVAVEQWQPIETAPKDGSRFLVWEKHYGIRIGRCKERADHDDWLSYMDAFDGSSKGGPRATHWMPLPCPPAALAAMPPKVEAPAADEVRELVKEMRLDALYAALPLTVSQHLEQAADMLERLTSQPKAGERS